MRPVMYIIANEGAGMSAGKLAAQVAHAAVEGYRLSVESDPRNPGQFQESNLIRHWYKGGHYTKIVLGAKDAQDLQVKREYLSSRGFQASLIVDEGRTEIEPFTPTAIGVEIVDKDNPHVQATFSSFDLYKERPKVAVIEVDAPLSPEQLANIRRAVADGMDPEKIAMWYRKRGTPPEERLRPYRARWFKFGS